MQYRYIWPVVGVVLIVTLGRLFIEQSDLRKELVRLQVPTMTVPGDGVMTYTRVAEPWAQVQSGARDTVVQILCQVAEVDIMQPYKTPSQGQAFGSGFFINDQGEIVTNAHVVCNARSIWVQVPSLGRHIIDADVIGTCPERDLALLKLRPAGLELIKKRLGTIAYLPLGDSDYVRRADEIMALGYPLGQHALKSTTGVVSGREHVSSQHYIQMSAPINPGSSGGPSLNRLGQVIGINSAIIQGAQNVGYIIPVNELKIVLPDLRKVQLLRKPYLGIFYAPGSEALTTYLGNPQPGGVYVVETFKKSILEQAGVRSGDMIYQVNGYTVDIYGEMNVAWSEDKISLADYVTRLPLNSPIHLVVYRKGARKDLDLTFNLVSPLPIRVVYPDYEPIDYEIFAGMVVTPLTLNHVFTFLSSPARLLTMQRYTDAKEQQEGALVISHIFPDSQAHRSRALTVGSVLQEVNGMPVRTMDQLRAVMRDFKKSPYMTIKTSGDVGDLFVVFPVSQVLLDEPRFSRDYHYPLSDTIKQLLPKK